MRKSLAAFIAFGTLAAPLANLAHAQAGGSLASATFAKSALVGMQLSVRKGLQQGMVSAPVAACVQALNDTSFNSVYEALLSGSLTPAEMQETDAFFSTPVGKKYAKRGIAKVYTTLGERAPEPPPDFSDAEYKELEDFSLTAAGDKLLVRKVLDKPIVKQAVATRIQELMKSCGAK